jgi:nucleotide-binding universal stress UspA family protein
MIRRILVPLDGSELSEKALGHVKKLLHGEDAVVVLARVVSDRDAERVETARLHVNALRDELAKEGARAEAHVVTGDPVDELLRLIRSSNPSLVVMATHARKGLDRLLHGSVAEQLVRRSPAPVLVTSARSAATDEVRFRKILVPLDGSDLAAEALGPACELAKRHGAELVLFHAIPVITGGGIDLPPVVYPLSISEAQEFLRSYVPRCGGLTTRTKVVLGPPSVSILDAAKQEGCDLVALSTHGRSGLARVAFGSVAEEVVRRAGCPLLLVKPVPEKATTGK